MNRHRLDERISASDIAEICLEEDIEIPAGARKTRPWNRDRSKLARSWAACSRTPRRSLFDEFRVVRQQERVSEAGNPRDPNRYTFSLVNPPGSPLRQPQPKALPDYTPPFFLPLNPYTP